VISAEKELSCKTEVRPTACPRSAKNNFERHLRCSALNLGQMHSWIILFFAGLFEIGFTTSMKLSENFTRLPYTGAFCFFAIFSFVLLNWSMASIPMATAYAVWTGIGASGTTLIGILFFGESASPLRIFFLATLVASIIGLKSV
jgi:quaternary ammonium compound-resistance protein SugE